MARVTMADVARAAEVSVSTVSHSLNGTGNLPRGTRDRVRAVAAALGYLPAKAAAGRARTLAVTVTTYRPRPWDFASIPYFARLIAAASSAAHEAGYALTTLPSDLPGERWAALDVDGVLLVDSPAEDEVVRVLRRRDVPIVFDGRPVSPLPGDTWVDNDHAAAAVRVLDHLWEGGARRVLLIGEPDGDDHFSRTSVAAYRAWCSRRGIRPEIMVFHRGKAVGPELGPALRRADAVYALYDSSGTTIMTEAARLGLRIPDDLRLVVVSEDPVYAAQGISTLSLDPIGCAEAAVRALIRLIEHPGSRNAPEIIPTRLQVRRSSMWPDGTTESG